MVEVPSIADKSIVPTVTAPVAPVFTVLAETYVPLTFVNVVTPSLDSTIDQLAHVDADALAAVRPIIESPTVSGLVGEQVPVPPSP